MDRKILRNARGRQKIADELYADHDISLKERKHLTAENQHDTGILLKGDVSYDMKHEKPKRGQSVMEALKEQGML